MFFSQALDRDIAGVVDERQYHRAGRVWLGAGKTSLSGVYHCGVEADEKDRGGLHVLSYPSSGSWVGTITISASILARESISRISLVMLSRSLSAIRGGCCDGMIDHSRFLVIMKARRSISSTFPEDVPPYVDGTLGDVDDLLPQVACHDNEAAAHLLHGVDRLVKDIGRFGVPALPEQDGVRPHATDPLALKKGLDSGVDVLLHDDAGEGGNAFLEDEPAEDGLSFASMVDKIAEVAADKLGDGDDPAVGGAPAGVLGEVKAVMGPAAQGQYGGAPVLRMVAFPLQAQKCPAGGLVGKAAVQVAPFDLDLRAGYEKKEDPAQDQGDGGPNGIDQEHDTEAPQGPEKCHGPVVEAEMGRKLGLLDRPSKKHARFTVA